MLVCRAPCSRRQVPGSQGSCPPIWTHSKQSQEILLQASIRGRAFVNHLEPFCQSPADTPTLPPAKSEVNPAVSPVHRHTNPSPKHRIHPVRRTPLLRRQHDRIRVDGARRAGMAERIRNHTNWNAIARARVGDGHTGVGSGWSRACPDDRARQQLMEANSNFGTEHVFSWLARTRAEKSRMLW